LRLTDKSSLAGAANQEGYTKTDRGKLDVTRLAFHSDQGATDLIALLSIGASPGGGESKWVSAVAIHNELLRRGRQVQSSSSMHYMFLACFLLLLHCQV